jgi:hypothetical protein
VHGETSSCLATCRYVRFTPGHSIFQRPSGDVPARPAAGHSAPLFSPSAVADMRYCQKLWIEIFSTDPLAGGLGGLF